MAQSERVRLFLREELLNNGAFNDVKDLPERIVSMAGNTLERRKVREEVSEYRHELACWKIVSTEYDWDAFLAKLHSNRLSVRDLDFVKSTIIKEEKALREEIVETLGPDDSALVVPDHYEEILIENVAKYDIRYKGKTIYIKVDRG